MFSVFFDETVTTTAPGGCMNVGAWVLVALATLIAIMLVLFMVIPLISWPFLKVQRRYDEEHEVVTEDGVRLRLYRLLAPERAESAEEGYTKPLPVLMMHGMAVSHLCFDIADQISLPRMLRRTGRDVWMADLRGRADSKSGCPRSWSFDDYVTKDLPAILAKIKAETGSERLHYLGYSMGGSVGFAWLARAILGPSEDPQAGFQSMLALGSPWPSRLGDMAIARVRAADYITWLGRLRLDWLSATSAWWFPWLRRLFIVRWITEPGNTEGPILRRAILSSTEPISLRVVANFFRSYREDHWRSDDRSVDYEEAWGRVSTPVRFVAGDRDRIVSPKCLTAGYERCGSPDKELHFLGPDTGTETHYGHVDLAWGRNIEQEVFPKINEWFERWEPTGSWATASNRRTPNLHSNIGSGKGAAIVVAVDTVES